VATPETEASGYARRIGEVWSESEPSASGVGPVIGERGDDIALSVLFETTEDVVWFAPHLLQPVERLQFPSRRLLFAFFFALSCAVVMAFADIGRFTVHRLTVINAATPCFPVQGYVTSGTYPNVLGASKEAARTNIALRRALVADQRSYARSARQHAAARWDGAYETTIDGQLTSASTVVVSALIPTLKLYPGDTGGQTWISATIDVHSGKPVSLSQILASPALALPALIAAWNTHAQLTPLTSSGHDIAGYAPSFTHYRHFALTPAGLAFGFTLSGSRSATVIPYRIVRPYLSPLGRRLVAGVRRPRPAPPRDQHPFTWASFQHSPADPAANWPMACT